jgi:predicted metal-binding membrane protein
MTALTHPAGLRALDRARLLLVGALIALAAAAWLLTDRRMAGMDAMPGGDLGGLGFYTSIWVVMMAAMMFPAIVPMVVTYDHLREAHRARAGGPPREATAFFVGGYLVTWAAAGLFAYGLLAAGRALSIDALAWDRAGPYVAGGVILAAAAYQLTPLKDACLTRCRAPVGFLMQHWRTGRRGALWMGTMHGAWCVGCCWALMASLFAVGVMSVGWMALVATLIALERLSPLRIPAQATVTVVLLLLGVALLVAPGSVPGLPDPEAAMPMEPMG